MLPVAPMDAALIIVAKRPEPGFTKTRLCPPFTPKQAAEFYRCLMKDTFALAARLTGVDHTVAYTPREAQLYFRDIVPDGFHLIPQHGDDLGTRLINALAHHFERGYRRAVIMNSDGPTLPLAHLEEAFRSLKRADITLGTGHDGGYYLIGMKHPHPGVFRGIAWSTEHVIPQTLEVCRRLRLTVHQLPEWYDVDVGADLERLRRDLADDQTAAPQTYAFLRELGKKFN